MPNKTPIEWTDYTSNPIYVTDKETGKRGWHCDKPSPGCGHCYAETINKRFGTKLDFHKKNAEKVDFHLNENELLEIIKLNNRLAKKNETAKLFLCDMTDLFLAEHPDEFIDKIFAVMALCPNITFQVLTKRADRMKKYFDERASEWTDFGLTETMKDFEEIVSDLIFGYEGQLSPALKEFGWFEDFFYGEYGKECDGLVFDGELPLKNVWLGVSVENQKTADERIPLLLETFAALRFLSCEPLLEEIDLTKVGRIFNKQNVLTPHQVAVDHSIYEHRPPIDWVVVGGESGAKARECNLDWIRSIVQQCQSTQTPVLVKQLGAKPFIDNTDEYFESMIRHYGSNKTELCLKDKKGGDLAEMPIDLQIREFPK